MALHPLAGKPAPRSLLANIPRLIAAYYEAKPDASQPSQRVEFGTSGHRGSALTGSFNEQHILAITEAICRYREAGISLAEIRELLTDGSGRTGEILEARLEALNRDIGRLREQQRVVIRLLQGRAKLGRAKAMTKGRWVALLRATGRLPA